MYCGSGNFNSHDTRKFFWDVPLDWDSAKMEKLQTNYYKKLIEPLNAPALAPYVVHCESGFSYTRLGLTVCLSRESKNYYKVHVIHAGAYECIVREKQMDAVNTALNVIALHLSGKL